MFRSCCRKCLIKSAFRRIAENASPWACTKTPCRYYSLPSKSDASPKYDVVIVGGGIVGLATARQLILKHPGLKLAVLEKESHLSPHQSGHNSGVLHAGIYYTPGSYKAKLCVEGFHEAYKYFDQNDVPYNKCGKLVVATTVDEIERLDALFERGLQNEVKDLRLIGPQEIKDIEPLCVGLKAIHSPHTGIVDWGLVARKFGEDFQRQGGAVHTDFEVTDFRAATESELQYPVQIIGKQKCQQIRCRYVLACAGLQADRVARLSGCSPEPKIVPFRGDYLLLRPEKQSLIKGNIYPVPNPAFPFLGVHFTPRMDGSVWLGPNAVLAFKREGYNLTDFNVHDAIDAVGYRGLRKLVVKNLKFGINELYRAFNVSAQVKLAQRFVPTISKKDVLRGPSGVRAQALDRDGQLVDDFVFDSGTGDLGLRMLHVRNSPSPAATASLAIARVIVERMESTFNL